MVKRHVVSMKILYLSRKLLEWLYKYTSSSVLFVLPFHFTVK